MAVYIVHYLDEVFPSGVSQSCIPAGINVTQSHISSSAAVKEVILKKLQRKDECVNMYYCVAKRKQANNSISSCSKWISLREIFCCVLFVNVYEGFVSTAAWYQGPMLSGAF